MMIAATERPAIRIAISAAKIQTMALSPLGVVTPNDRAVDYCGDRSAAELSSMKGCVAALRWRVINIICPAALRIENGDISRKSKCQRAAVQPQNIRWARRVQLDHLHQRNPAGMYELLERKPECGFET